MRDLIALMQDSSLPSTRRQRFAIAAVLLVLFIALGAAPE